MSVIVLNRVVNLAPPKKAFADCTWAEVSAICKVGYAAKYWQIGDTKPMVAGETTEILRIIGFDHDPVTDAAAYGREKAGITLEMVDEQKTLKDVMNKTNYINTAWYSSDSTRHCNFRKTLLPNFLNDVIADDLKSVIVPVDKEFLDGSGNTGTISDVLFLLSTNELTGTYASGNGSEGEQYAYYAAGNSRVRGVDYWTRSIAGSNARFQYIKKDGTVSTTNVITTGLYGIPCFCI